MVMKLNLGRRTALRFSAVTLGLTGLAKPGLSQTLWPNRPVRWLVPYPPGGQTDIVSRYLGDRLSAAFGQQVIIENKAGAQGIVGSPQLSRLQQMATHLYTSILPITVSTCLPIQSFRIAKKTLTRFPNLAKQRWAWSCLHPQAFDL